MILLDTCALLWLAIEPKRLSADARAAIRRHADALAVSPISAWEIATKAQSGKLRFPKVLPPLAWYRKAVERYALRECPLDAATLCRAVALPPLHHDPCDRMIIATAIVHDLPVVTADGNFARYPSLTVIW
jgi:PIN domain nuclease of toxin-antitoxin system